MGDYEAWLNSYVQSINQMNPIQRAVEQRSDYHEEGHAYADYLDYVEEWEWHASEKQSELVTKVIYVMGHKHNKIQCNCRSTHVLTVMSEPEHGDTIVDDVGINLASACWYRTITKASHSALHASREASARLPDPLESLLGELAKVQKVCDGQTPTLLPYDVFRTVWWGKESDHNAGELLYQLPSKLKKKISERMVESSPRVEQNKILLWWPHDDHGMHSLLQSVGEAKFRRILSLINEKRKIISNRAEHISYEDVLERVATCDKCKATIKVAGLSIFGVYHAPPGARKTTAANNQLHIHRF
jgi:hypothetical protein